MGGVGHRCNGKWLARPGGAAACCPQQLSPVGKGRNGKTLPGLGRGGKARCHPWAKAREFNLQPVRKSCYGRNAFAKSGQLLTSNVLASLPWVLVSRYFLGLNPCLLCLPIFFPKATLTGRVVLAFGEIRTDNDVRGTVPYRAVAAAPVRGRGRGCAAAMVPARSSARGCHTIWAFATTCCRGLPTRSHARKCPCWQGGERGPALLVGVFFFPPSFFPNKHIAASGQLLFSRGDM